MHSIKLLALSLSSIVSVAAFSQKSLAATYIVGDNDVVACKTGLMLNKVDPMGFDCIKSEENSLTQSEIEIEKETLKTIGKKFILLGLNDKVIPGQTRPGSTCDLAHFKKNKIVWVICPDFLPSTSVTTIQSSK
jgi:hypothetical protein